MNRLRERVKKHTRKELDDWSGARCPHRPLGGFEKILMLDQYLFDTQLHPDVSKQKKIVERRGEIEMVETRTKKND